MPRKSTWLGMAVLVLLGACVAAGVLAPDSARAAFRQATRLFYEQSRLADLRFPSQWALARVLVPALLATLGLLLLAWARLASSLRAALLAFWAGALLRSLFWLAGGNLPMVPGDESHYVEVATSITRGEGPVKHYVESFFRDYRPQGIVTGRGVLDDWATPLWAYVLAGAYRLTGVVPSADFEATFAVAKGTSFLINLATLPLLFLFARRWFGPRVALGALGTAAVLPVHAIYAGFALRESLVAATSLLAVGLLLELTRTRGAWAWAIALAAGIACGLAILARNTAMVIVGVAWLVVAVRSIRSRTGPVLLAAVTTAATIAPWAWATFQVYGEPFYTYTKFFAYNFSWTIHHYDRGNTTPGAFFTAANLPEILRTRARSAGLIAATSTMLLSLPLALGFLARLRPGAGDESRSPGSTAAAVFLAFAAATLVQIADVTQVEQLGRYYLPVFLLMVPAAVAGLLAFLDARTDARGRAWALALLPVLLWSSLGWAYDSGWPWRPYQLHLPAMREAGAWIRNHPEAVPPDSRVLTWFPWELRLTSDRTTVLFPRALEGGPYELRRIQDTVRQYQVTHILWGSFEPMPDPDPETLGPYLTTLRESLGLTDAMLLHATDPRQPYPVRLYRVPGIVAQ